ncbi:MAG: Uncharacterised protein [Methanobacteriota archaeon]|nr:MAG: Uncharacterised protein [Euryarchaeota archaeon]
MTKGVIKSILVLLIMISSGCTGAIEDAVEAVEDIETIPPVIDDVIEPFTHMMEWMEIGSRERTSPELISYNSCEDLEIELKTNIKERMRITMLQQNYGGGMWIEDDMVMEDGMAEGAPVAADTADSGGAANSNTREEGVDFSGTNNQEEGVDESDFVKTDGNYIYMINQNKLVILGVPEFGELNFQSSTNLEGNAREMMLAEDKLVILSSVYSWSLSDDDPLRNLLWDNIESRMRVNSLTKFTVYDISNRTTPILTNELFLEGSYLTAREEGGMVRTITQGYMDLPSVRTWVEIPAEYQDQYYSFNWDDPARQEIWNLSVNQTIETNNQMIDAASLEDLMPQMYLGTLNGITKVPMRSETCSEFVSSLDSVGTQFTSILTLDLLSEAFSYEADHLMGNWPVVYASQNTLVIAEPAQDWWWYWGADEIEEATNIHAFSLSDQGTEYIGSGRVDGTVLDQFSLSEYEGNIRLATTTGQWNRWWINDPEPMENHVIVLQPNTTTSSLDEIGRIDGIAPDENIWSARFVEDRAYIVTFRQIDPLWTIDLSDPTNPQIIGELEVPGVSTYIHPLDENNVLTIGIGPANNDGTGLDWSSTQISLFDVSDFSNPTLASVLPLSPVSENERNEWTWSWSEATYEHKAFQYWGPQNLLAIPLSTHRTVYIESSSVEEKQAWCEDQIEYMTWRLSQGNEDEDPSEEEAPVEEEGSTTSKQSEGDPPPADDTTDPGDDSGETEDAGNDNSELTEEEREFLMEYCMTHYNYNGYYKYEYISKLILVDVTDPLSVYGTVNHSQFYDTEECDYCYWYNSDTTIKRSIFMGDYIYAISLGGITVTNLTSMEGTEELKFSDYIEDNNESDLKEAEGETDDVVVTG